MNFALFLCLFISVVTNETVLSRALPMHRAADNAARCPFRLPLQYVLLQAVRKCGPNGKWRPPTGKENERRAAKQRSEQTDRIYSGHVKWDPARYRLFNRYVHFSQLFACIGRSSHIRFGVRSQFFSDIRKWFDATLSALIRR